MSAGSIAGKFAATASAMKDELNLYAVASRSLEKSRAFAQEHGIGRYYGSYEEMLSDDAVDAVYVCTPNGMHFENAKACLEHGKHVLCEKPFTENAGNARRLFELARAKNRFIMEAFWTKFLPSTARMFEIIESGEIGEVSYVSAGIGIWPDRARLEGRLDPALAGGAILDLGPYTIGLPCMLFGYSPKKVTSAVRMSDMGTDEFESVVMEFGGGKIASVFMSIGAVTPDNCATVYGTKGKLVMPEFNGGEKIFVTTDAGASYAVDCPFEINGFEYEIREAIKCIAAGRIASDIMKPEHTVAVMEIMDGLRESWGMRYPNEA